MATEKYYLENTKCLRLESVVTAVSQDETGRAVLRLKRTIFHPQGGGQPSDSGSIGGQQVAQVRHAQDGEVDHTLVSAQAPAVGAAVELVVDEAAREANARSHTAGHLIAALVEQAVPGARAVSGHHWPMEARVEFEGAANAHVDDVLHTLKIAIERAIAHDWPVTQVGDPYASRAIRIDTHQPVPCGGTHVQSIAQLGVLEITKVRQKAGLLRVSYRAG
jgi:alanyl-tRNA synthetase